MIEENPEKVNLSIIIVNYKSSDFLLGCIKSIFESQLDVKYEIIVVDNASADEGLAAVKKTFPEVTFIDAEKNNGFAAGNNKGINKAKGGVLLLLNPDTVVNENTIQQLYDKINSDPKIGIVGPKMFYEDGKLQTKNIIKKIPTLFAVFSHLFFLDNLFPKIKLFNSHYGLESDCLKEQNWENISGACLMIKREVVEKIGLMDENFFLYFEETDWCFRAIKEGYKILYVPSASITHFVGGSGIPSRKRNVFAYYESQSYFFKKHYGIFHFTALYLLDLIGFSFRLLITPVYLIAGKNAAKIKRNLFAFLFHLNFCNYIHILKLVI
jgi:GT2 family glycosyltransferase